MIITATVSENYLPKVKVNSKISVMRSDCEGAVSVKLYDLGSNNSAFHTVSLSAAEIKRLYKSSLQATDIKLLKDLGVI